MAEDVSHVIAAIAGSKKLAVVGVSDKKFGGYAYHELKKRGYEVIPVHPVRESFDGDKCVATLKEVPPDVTAALVAVGPEAVRRVVADAATSSVTHLWFQQGTDCSEAVAEAQALGIKSVSNKCIMMYAEPVRGIHAFHRFLAKLFGRY